MDRGTSTRQRILAELLEDTRATIGAEHDIVVTSNAGRIQGFERTLSEFVQQLVDDVQQQIHDDFIDVTWPRCPRHMNHPLWFRDGQWWCECDSVVVAELGHLRLLRAPARPEATE